jgi:hypothetical protein
VRQGLAEAGDVSRPPREPLPADVQLVGEILARHFYSPWDDGQECTDVVMEILAALHRDRLPQHLRGDGPCGDCGTLDHIIWFTDDVLWNEVVRHREPNGDPLMCITCFVARVNAAGFAPTGWRLVPDWHWETTAENAARHCRDRIGEQDR